MSILNLTQHSATLEQLTAGVLDLPTDIRGELSVLLTFTSPPSKADLDRRAFDVWWLVADYLRPGGKVMIGGAPFFMGSLEAQFKRQGFSVVYAFSERVSVDQPQADGSVRKVVLFRHSGFVEV